jgi:aminoglycoside N3'-acetyltransferase
MYSLKWCKINRCFFFLIFKKEVLYSILSFGVFRSTTDVYTQDTTYTKTGNAGWLASYLGCWATGTRSQQPQNLV